MVMFRRQHPKWNQKPWFVPETTSILSTFAYRSFSLRVFNICRLRPFDGRLRRVKLVILWILTKVLNILSQKCSILNKFSHERFYKQKFPVIIEVSSKKISHFPEVPAHTGLTILDCRKRKRTHWKSQNCRAAWIFEWFKPWLNVLKDEQSRELRIIRTTCPAVYLYVSIITQVIIEIRALPFVENGVIFRYNHLSGGEYSGRTNFLNLMKESAILRNAKHATKFGMTLFKGKMWKLC